MDKSPQEENYSVLAEIYDDVMGDVDYETWTDYIDDIIVEHNPESVDILELACGTGTMALSLEELDCYTITATDASPEMIRVAQQKAERMKSDIEFRTMNFLDLQFEKTFDVVYMVFDSLNYLHTEEEILELHRQVRDVLKPDGIFIYDFTTPRNSRKAIHFLNHEEKVVNRNYRYRRTSRYDEDAGIHTNCFIIEQTDPHTKKTLQTFQEEHRQKIYTQREIETMIKKTDFKIVMAYDGFELKPAHSRSLRITMVLK
ncbi:class I SAM-dependent methyltransferase [Rhodohalobacter mucosus]|uniref:Class I SAM-dependent methyltransferase n=2 Tax=Rhodohalobacter mucosus TaxID=2079485 RepID=A0A316TTI6_9BACT|nr:class I SAM-dependent methyltransferase [Rhodohalobacter mucosus]